MNRLGADEYVETRLDDQIDWYDRKSQENQAWYKRLRLIEIVAAGLIPFMAGYAAPEGDAFKAYVRAVRNR